MQKTTLKSLLTIKNGVDYRNCGNGCVPVYGSGGYITSIDSFLYDGESILLPRKGTLENIMFVSGKFWTVDTIYWTIINTKLVDTYYLFNYLKMLDLSNFRTGTTLPSMTNNAYYGITVFLPSIAKQKDISVLLRNIDSKIDINNKINAELEATAKDLYNYWFVQFDFPDGNGRPYKSSGGKMVYKPILKREIPDGWAVERLKFLCDVTTGKEDASLATEKGRYAFFTCGDNVLRCDKAAFDGKAILVAGNGNFNVKYYEGKFNAYQRTYVLMPNNKKYFWPIYIGLLDTISKFIKGSNGSIVKFIKKGDIEDVSILLPKNLELLNVFNGCLTHIDRIKKENSYLSNLRDFLLPMLMNGQVSVE